VALEDAGRTVRIDLAGDAELRTLIDALEFAVKTLKHQACYNSDLPKAVESQSEVIRREVEELSEARWDQRQSKQGGQRLREAAKRIVLSSQHLESCVKDNTYPTV
jgi:hypothetical protein